MQLEEVFDITDTAVLVLEELVMWCALVGHILPPKCDPDPLPPPPPAAPGVSGTVRSGGNRVSV